MTKVVYTDTDGTAVMPDGTRLPWDERLRAAGARRIPPRRARPLDPRDPDHARTGIFVHHNCSGCKNGALPCREGRANSCGWPRARND